MAKKKTYEFKVGDRVAYSVAFLRSTSQLTGWPGHARGTVKAVEDMGASLSLCVIAWDNHFVQSDYHDDGYGRVIASNLVPVSKIGEDSALNT